MATCGEIRRMRLVMSWSTTQRAVFNGLGRVMVFPTAEAQDDYQRQLHERLDAAERGEPWPQDRWVMDSLEDSRAE